MTQRILLVEDDPVSRDVLAALLSTRGYIVDTADDGFSGLRMAQDETYDLIFIDYHLPEMDGYALARLMRTLGAKTDSKLKMVAITADRFGLAARRGVDSVFDNVLAKPIEPDTLFAFVEACLADVTVQRDLESFLETPKTDRAHDAAQVLWRVRGLTSLPAVAVFPEPTDVERTRLEYCFRLVEPDTADCLLVLRPSGLAQIGALRASARAYLKPLIAIDAAMAAHADLLFQVSDGESWSKAAICLASFQSRRNLLKGEARDAMSLDARLAAYLYVADRSLTLRRDVSGQTLVPYTGGFAVSAVIEAVKALASKGLVTAKSVVAEPDSMRELCVSLTPKGLESLVKTTTSVLSAG